MQAESDIAIVGAGAAGLTAAIFAAHDAAPRTRVVLLDGAKTIGAKILVAGGGRCNVTHEQIELSDYNGSKNIVRNVLAAFDEEATVAWFKSLGVTLKREPTGKLFPTTDNARTVLNALLSRCAELGVVLQADHRVQDIPPLNDDGLFKIQHSQGLLASRRLIMATGGLSLPKTGSDGAGWEMVRRLGHTVTPTYPALVPLILDDGFFHSQLSGLSHEAELSTFANGKLVDRRTESLLWTHFGISGPVVMDASRHWVIAHATATAEMRCNFLPGQTFEAVENRLLADTQARPRATAASLLSGLVPDRLSNTLLAHAGIDRTVPLAHISREARRKLTHTLTALQLPILRDRGWNYAEVTAGGVPLQEIDYRTMASRKIPGLYLVGEMLDCDGRIGGFNFQWAWATGYIAGKAAASAPIKEGRPSGQP